MCDCRCFGIEGHLGRKPLAVEHQRGNAHLIYEKLFNSFSATIQIGPITSRLHNYNAQVEKEKSISLERAV